MTRHLTKLLLAASALTVLAAAPAAYAAPAVDTKLNSTQKIAKRAAETASHTVKLAERSDRGDRSRNRGDRSRNRGDRSRNRGDRSRNRGDRSRNRGHRSDRHRSDRHRGDRHRSYRHRSDRHRSNRHRSNWNRGFNVRNFGHNRRGYRTNYRSNRGISFHFGTPGYSAFRWAPAAHSFYRPSYGSFGYYQRRTVCQRVIVDGWHNGYRVPVSVKQCSNPWDGSYIVQGSERLVGHHW